MMRCWSSLKPESAGEGPGVSSHRAFCSAPVKWRDWNIGKKMQQRLLHLYSTFITSTLYTIYKSLSATRSSESEEILDKVILGQPSKYRQRIMYDFSLTFLTVEEDRLPCPCIHLIFCHQVVGTVIWEESKCDVSICFLCDQYVTCMCEHRQSFWL